MRTGQGLNKPGVSDPYQDFELTPERATRTKAEAWMNLMMVVKGEEREMGCPSLYTHSTIVWGAPDALFPTG